MLTEAKKQKLIENIKLYIKKFLSGSITDLDESGTRIMINHSSPMCSATRHLKRYAQNT